MLCNILHRYLQQADYSVIEEATMVSARPLNLLFSFVSILGNYPTWLCVVKWPLKFRCYMVSFGQKQPPIILSGLKCSWRPFTVLINPLPVALIQFVPLLLSIPEWWGSCPCDSKEGSGCFGQTMDEIYCCNSRLQSYWSDEAQSAYQTQRASAEPRGDHLGPGQRCCTAEWHQRRWSWIWIWRRWELTAFSVQILFWPTHLLPQMDCETPDLYVSVFAQT